MSNATAPYIVRYPGDLWTAADFMDLQSKIQADIEKKTDDAKQDVINTGVKRADNADKFDNKTPKNWTDELDERYAFKVHDHEGMANYRRYYREVDKAEETFILLEHKLGRFPLVDVYQLLDIPVPGVTQGTPAQQVVTKFLLYYGHEELDLLQNPPGFLTTKRLPRRTLGTSWEQLLAEYQVQYTDDDSLEDVFNDFLDAFFKLPASDEIDHHVSKWIDDHRDNRTIGELKKRGEWDDIRWVVMPQKLVAGQAPAAPDDHGNIMSPIDVIHLNYNTLAVRYNDQSEPNPDKVDLMIVLRS